jgi:hypothetical protein
MRLHVMSVGDQPYHHAQRDVFIDLARRDDVGEHELEDDPARADVLLVVDLHQHPGDPFLAVLREHPLVRAHPRNVVVYDERDLPFFTFPGVYVSGVGAAFGDARRRESVAGGPYPTLPNAPPPAARAPDLLYAFQGARTHPVRDAILSLRHERGIVEDSSGVDFLGPSAATTRATSAASPSAAASSSEPVDAGRARYAELVGRSKFVLCPRGHGPSSFRLYETLSAGRVPVVISDDWLAPPRVDWDACSVRVAECDVAGVPRLLERLEPRWPEMAATSRAAFAEHFSNGRLWHHYATSIASLRRGSRGAAPWWAQPAVLRIAVRRRRAAVRRTWT